MVSEQRWLTVREAGTALGITESAVRKRVTKGTLDARAGNDGRARVLVADFPQPASQLLPESPDPGGGAVADLREQVARLEERLLAATAMEAELRRQVEAIQAAARECALELCAELERERRAREEAERRRAEDDRRYDEVLRQIGELREERRQRRQWPGLRAWWRRLIEGEGGGSSVDWINTLARDSLR